MVRVNTPPLTIEPTDAQPQNSEEDMIELKGGRLGLIFMRFTGGTSDYAARRLVGEWWEGIEPQLRMVQARVVRSPEEIFAAMQQGLPMIGQTEIRNEKTGRVAVIEFPIKTVNCERNLRD